MKKRPVISFVMVFLALFTLAFVQALPASVSEDGDEVTIWTRAICNDNGFCIDVEVVCQADRLIDMKPIPAGIYHSDDWEDARPTDFKAKWCQ